VIGPPPEVTLVAVRFTVPPVGTSVFDTVKFIFGTGLPPPPPPAVAVIVTWLEVVVAPTLSVAVAVKLNVPAIAVLNV
jgi:hypothetical protein